MHDGDNELREGDTSVFVRTLQGGPPLRLAGAEEREDEDERVIVRSID